MWNDLLQESELSEDMKKWIWYDHLQILFRLGGPETGKKVGRRRSKAERCILVMNEVAEKGKSFHVLLTMYPLGSELVTDPDEEVSSFLSYIYANVDFYLL